MCTVKHSSIQLQYTLAGISDNPLPLLDLRQYIEPSLRYGMCSCILEITLSKVDICSVLRIASFLHNALQNSNNITSHLTF